MFGLLGVALPSLQDSWDMDMAEVATENVRVDASILRSLWLPIVCYLCALIAKEEVVPLS